MGEGADTQPQLDAVGNIIGGVPNPAVDVPVSTQTGVRNKPGFCRLVGTSEELSSDELAKRYPSHENLIAQWTSDVQRLAFQGYLRPRTARTLIAATASSSVGG